MSVTRHWVTYDKDGFGAHAVVTRQEDADAFRRAGHEVEGPFVLEAEHPLGAVEALDSLAAAVRDTLCDEEACGRCRVLRDALPSEAGQ